jgi:hypothetical protein
MLTVLTPWQGGIDMRIKGLFVDCKGWLRSAGEKTTLSRFVGVPDFIRLPVGPIWWSVDFSLRLLVAAGLVLAALILAFYGDEGAVAFLQSAGYGHANAQAIVASLSWFRWGLIIAAVLWLFSPLRLRAPAMLLAALLLVPGFHDADPDVGHSPIHDIDWSTDFPNELELEGVDPSYFDRFR